MNRGSWNGRRGDDHTQEAGTRRRGPAYCRIDKLFLSTPTFQTLPVRIWSTLQYQIEPSVTAISTLLIGMTVGALVIVQLLKAASARISTSWTTAE